MVQLNTLILALSLAARGAFSSTFSAASTSDELTAENTKRSYSSSSKTNVAVYWVGAAKSTYSLQLLIVGRVKDLDS